MANPSGSESQRTWLEVDHLTYILSTISNPHIHFVEANNKQNKRHYDVLVYAPPSKAPAFAVIWYNNQWHECYSEAKTYQPFLGPIRVEVHATDVVVEIQSDEPTAEESTTDDERESDMTFQYTPANIKISGPGSTHREDQQQWTPLITPTTDTSHRSTFS